MAERKKQTKKASSAARPSGEEGVEGSGTAGAAQDGLGFDERLARLEALVAEMEGGELDLEAALGRYQEGVGHLRRCQDQLRGFRARVEELSLDGELSPFEGDPDADGPGA